MIKKLSIYILFTLLLSLFISKCVFKRQDIIIQSTYAPAVINSSGRVQSIQSGDTLAWTGGQTLTGTLIVSTVEANSALFGPTSIQQLTFPSGEAVTSIVCNGTGSTTCSSASCSNPAGTFTPNSGATSCVVTFSATFGTSPTCNVNATNGSLNDAAFISSRAATSITIGFTTGATSVDYTCFGHS